MNKKVLILFVIFVLFIFIFNAYSDNPKYLFKIASDAPDKSIWVESIKKIGRELYKSTNGEIGIRVYPGGVMGDQNDVIKKIKIGQLSGAALSSGGLGLIYKDFLVMGFPLIFKNYDEYDYVKEKMTSFFEKEFEKRGYVFLGWSEVGLIYVYSKKKVHSIDTLRSAKPFLVEGDEISYALFKEAKVTPVPLQISDVMTSLQTGTIDTVFSSPYGLIVMQWHTNVKYMASFPITLMIGAVLVDKNLFYSMPASYQTEMKKMFKSTLDGINSKIRSDNNKALEVLKKNGLVILPVDNKDKDIFYNVCDKVAMKLTEKEYSRSLYNKIIGYIKEYRKK